MKVTLEALIKIELDIRDYRKGWLPYEECSTDPFQKEAWIYKEGRIANKGSPGKIRVDSGIWFP